MKAARLFSCFSACLFLALSANAQQPATNPVTTACGSTPASFTVKRAPATIAPIQPPPGKALVYLVETTFDVPLVNKKVNIGLDGTWIAATDANSHISFTVDPGVHHLCAAYERRALMSEESQTLLLHLNAQAGHTYYLSYRALLTQPSIAFFQPVDDDEGLFLVHRTAEAVSTLKK
jgi:hypothetical protein